MILTLFVILIIIGLVLIGLGYLFEGKVISILGFAFLVILGSIMVGGGVDYVSGEGVNFSYDYITFNYTEDGENRTDLILNFSSEVKANNYTGFDNDNSHWLGVLLVASGILGFVSVMVESRSKKEEGED